MCNDFLAKFGSLGQLKLTLFILHSPSQTGVSPHGARGGACEHDEEPPGGGVAGAERRGREAEDDGQFAITKIQALMGTVASGALLRVLQVTVPQTILASGIL